MAISSRVHQQAPAPIRPCGVLLQEKEKEEHYPNLSSLIISTRINDSLIVFNKMSCTPIEILEQKNKNLSKERYKKSYHTW
jgi:hypothetical protein